ncbi:hypothetical protein [Candidatus Methylocalor cossyra]|uniref:Uncharacterized protein n=1 Tax=Candidatus Methylocalor cossyra TaxID=3108543 RepID=A0ABP1CCZ6_9GAMM
MLRRFSTETPYELTEVTEAFIRLQSMGLDASAMGKPIMQFIEAVADASVGEFERLAPRSPFSAASSKWAKYQLPVALKAVR